MPTYQFDPSIGESVEVGNVIQSAEAKSEGPSLEQVQRHRVQQTAQGLAARQQTEVTPGDSQDYASEASLYQLQRELNAAQQAGNHLRVMELEGQCQKMAAALVGDVFPAKEAPEEAKAEADQKAQDFIEEYKNQNPDCELDLAYAGQVMDAELAGSINELIEDNSDQLSQVTALELVKELRANPKNFASRDDSDGVSVQLEEEIASEFGPELAHAISVLGNGVAAKVISTQQAIRTAGNDPALLNCIKTLVAQGRLRIAL